MTAAKGLTGWFRRPRRVPAGGVVLMSAAVLLVACAGQAERTTAAGVEPRPAAPAAAPVSVPVAALPAAPAREPEPTVPEPASLRGLDGGQLENLLGQPKFKRRDNPAEIWQYRTDACALDFFLYRGKEDPAYRVRHVEARGRDKGSDSEKDCLASVLKARDGRRAG